MHPVLLGVLCAFVSFVALLLVLCLCQRCGVFRRCFGLRSKGKTAKTSVIELPDLSYSARQEYVQPRFEEGSLSVTPHIRLAASSEDDDTDSYVEQYSTGVDPDELRGRLRHIMHPVSSGLLDFDLCYNKEMKQLCGVIVQARELPMIRDRLPNTFAQVELFPGHQYSHRTQIKHGSSSPAYGECFQFGPTDLDQLISCGQLQFRIYHTAYLRKEECIACVDVPLADFSADDLIEGEIRICRAMIKPYAKSVDVSPSISRTSSMETPTRRTPLTQDSGRPPILRYRSPQIFLTKATGTLLNLEVESARGGAVSDSEIVIESRQSRKLKKNIGTLGMLQFSLLYTRESGQLLVTILKARDLQRRLNIQPPDVSVKLYIYNNIEHRKHSKKVTVKRRGTDPVFNQSFILHLHESALACSQLVLSVIDSFGTSRSSYRVIGSVILGSNVSGEKECQHWLDVMKPDGDGQQITMWHSIRLI